MKRLLALLVGLLMVGATAGIVQAANTSETPEVRVHALYVQGKPVKIIEKNGTITVVETPGLDRKKVFEAVNDYFVRKHKLNKIKSTTIDVTSTSFVGENSDYRERKIFSIPNEGDVYIAAYAYCEIEYDLFSRVSVGGYSAAYSWIDPYDYWWTQEYKADKLTLSITLKFVGVGISLSIPPGIGFTGTSDTASFSETEYYTDYLGYDFSGIEAASLGGIWRIEDHTSGTFKFSYTGNYYTQGATVILHRGVMK